MSKRKDAKNVAIMTLYGEYNYGNRLQNYAVTQSLLKLGYNVETVVPIVRKKIKQKIKRTTLRIVSCFFGAILMKIKSNYVRFNNFQRFTIKYVPTRYIETKNFELPESLSNEYDMFVTGSDQVWNTSFGYHENVYNNYLLGFVSPEKRCCFSPSFGISFVEEKHRDMFKQELKKFHSLNAREEAGTKIIKELTGRDDVLTTIDPTLMLTKEEWYKVAKPIKKLPSEYTLDYFLGKTPTEDELYKSVSEECEKIKLLDKTNKKIYVSGPSEFIYLISKAKLVCTDSFHACVFSIIFEKPFIVFKREDSMENMFSRIETLLGMFGVDSKECAGKIINIDREKRDSVLLEERNKIIRMLQD